MAYKSSFTGVQVDQALDEQINGVLVSNSDVAGITSPVLAAKIYDNTDGVVYLSKEFTLEAGASYLVEGFLQFGNQDAVGDPQTSELYIESTNLVSSYAGGWFGSPNESSGVTQSNGFSAGKFLVGATPSTADQSLIFSALSLNTRDSLNLRGIFNVDSGGAGSVRFLINVGAGDSYWVGNSYFKLTRVESSDLYTLPTPA